MIKKIKNGIEWLEFELFKEIPWLSHGVFLRKGGYSPPPYESLNLSLSVGDTPENVRKNEQAVAAILNVRQIASAKQVHGSDIKAFHPATGSFLGECDGLSTSHPEVAIKITHADCQATLFVDPIRKAVAAVHCGWRGSIQNIYEKTIQHMQRMYNSAPENLLVGISPSLGPQSAQFVHFQKELPESFWSFQTTPFYFDFWQISSAQLIQAGILPAHMQIAGIDTLSNSEDFFSHRRESPRGANGTFITIHKEFKV